MQHLVNIKASLAFITGLFMSDITIASNPEEAAASETWAIIFILFADDMGWHNSIYHDLDSLFGPQQLESHVHLSNLSYHETDGFRYQYSKGYFWLGGSYLFMLLKGNQDE